MTEISITAFGASVESLDNTDAIQRALDKAGPGDHVHVPAASGEFLVDATRSVFPRSDTNLIVEGRLRAIPNSAPASAVVQLRGVQHVSVTGPGIIAGERAGHTRTGPARGGGVLSLLESSYVTVGNGLTCSDSWSDGIYQQDCMNVVIDHAFCNNNSRNGMSIISGQAIRVTHCVFENTHSESPMPQAGIDIEPDLPTQTLLDVFIIDNQFYSNKGAGVYVALGNSAHCNRIYVTDSAFFQHYKNGLGPPVRGFNDKTGWALYSLFRWVPGYDYWCFPTSVTIP